MNNPSESIRNHATPDRTTARPVVSGCTAEELARFPEENPNPVLRIGRDGTMLYANPASAPLMAEFAAHPGERVSGEWRRRIAGILATGRATEVEVCAGKREHVLVCVPFEDEEYVNVYGRDVTEQRKAEMQLRQTQKLDAIGQLAGGVAHDFNNILTGIRGYADLLLAKAEPGSTAHEDLTQIRELTERAAALTRQLLAFSRRQPLATRVADLNHIVEGAARMIGRLIGEDIDLRFVPDPDLGRAEVDPGQIEQVLVNLAVNARDAMPDGGRLTIETSNVELDEDYARRHQSVVPGRYVMLAVTDAGHGMDAAVRERMFEPFFTTKELGKGTGLGLSTVYGIVKQHRGNIWVYSEPGLGTTFKIYFPRVEAKIAPSPTLPEAVPTGGVETILVVEDDKSVREISCRALRARGYTVLPAATPAEAEGIARAHGGVIHLLLTDVVMPQCNGCQLYQRLLAARPGLRVAYCSGYTNNAIVHQSRLDAGVAFIQKPFTPNALAAKVREVLDAPPAREGAPR